MVAATVNAGCPTVQQCAMWRAALGAVPAARLKRQDRRAQCPRALIANLVATHRAPEREELPRPHACAQLSGARRVRRLGAAGTLRVPRASFVPVAGARCGLCVHAAVWCAGAAQRTRCSQRAARLKLWCGRDGGGEGCGARVADAIGGHVQLAKLEAAGRAPRFRERRRAGVANLVKGEPAQRERQKGRSRAGVAESVWGGARRASRAAHSAHGGWAVGGGCALRMRA